MIQNYRRMGMKLWSFDELKTRCIIGGKALHVSMNEHGMACRRTNTFHNKLVEGSGLAYILRLIWWHVVGV